MVGATCSTKILGLWRQPNILLLAIKFLVVASRFVVVATKFLFATIKFLAEEIYGFGNLSLCL